MRSAPSRQPIPWPVPSPERQSASGSLFPRPLTSFIGREPELAAISTLLRSPARLVTITGPGGAGKTRFAVRAAAEFEGVFPNRAFVSLAEIRDPALVPLAIAQALDVRDTGESSLLDRLARQIDDLPMLLLLDNFEQVVDAATAVTVLLERCPELKVLVTSRTVLRVSGEHEFRVHPLPLPAPAQTTTLAEVLRSPAVALFVDRARAANASFELTTDNAPAVVAICARVDGLPLGIELAAAHSRLLSPNALLTHLDRRLALLTGGPRDQPTRLQSMRDTIAWSYELLSPEQQAAFLAVGVFAGGFTLEAARAVCAPEASEHELLLGLSALVDASLLAAEPQLPGGGPELRFQMLETIREFAAERLAVRSESAGIHQRHAAYFLDLAQRAESRLIAAGASAWVERLAREWPNLRAAVAWSLANGQAELVLQLAGTLLSFAYARGEPAEALAWLEGALARSGGPMTETRSDASFVASALAQVQGDFVRSRQHCEEALRIARALGYRLGQLRALIGLGITSEWSGDLAEAASHYTAASEIAAETEGQRLHHWIVLPTANLADVALLRGDAAAAMALGERAAGLWREEGYVWGIAQALGTVAAAARERGETARAAGLYAETLDHWLACFDGRGIAGTVAGIAALAADLERAEHAAVLLGAAWAINAKLGIRYMAHHLYAERVLAEVQDRLAPGRFAELWKTGQRLSLDAAIAEARSVLRQAEQRSRATHGLTPRELGVLRLLAAGRSDREIAAALSISPRTVQSHVAALFSKLGASSRAEAAALAVRKGLA